MRKLILFLVYVNLWVVAFAQAQNDGVVSLLFAGDAMQHQKQLDTALKNGDFKTYDYSDCFTFIAPEIQNADYAVCNLEVPLGGGPDYSGFPNFSAPDSFAKALREAGFDMMLTANNHCLDRGDSAARRTLRALDTMGIDHIGTYKDREERKDKTPYIKEIGGIKIGFLNYTYGTNGIEPQSNFEVNSIVREEIENEIKLSREAGAEILVVAIHWGTEYVVLESPVQKDLAEFLIENGVDIVIGGHPHVVQPMLISHNDKEQKDVLVVYSLGNFISNMSTPDTSGGALVRVYLQRDENGKARLKGADYDTFYVVKPEGEFGNFTVLPSWMAEKIPPGQKDSWHLFDRTSSEIFDKYNVNVSRAHE